MDFTQLEQVQSFSCLIDEKVKNFQKPFSYANKYNQESQLSNIMNEMLTINKQKSLSLSILKDSEDILDKQGLNFIVNSEKKSEDKQTLEIDSTPKNIEGEQGFRKSNIFLPKPIKPKSSKSQTNEKIQYFWEIRVYFFGKPIFRDIPISQNTNISELIRKCLEISVKDNIIEQNHFSSNNPLNYSMHLPEKQSSFKPDLNINPIEHHRLLSETLIQALILLPKTDKFEKRKKSILIQNEKDESLDLLAKGNIKIYLYNQSHFQIATVILPQNSTLKEIFSFLQNQDVTRFVLTESLAEQSLPLTSQIELKNLQSNKIYVKKKVYLDEPEINVNENFKAISLLPKSLLRAQSTINFPIGIKQASTYQQFNIVKINPRGVKQERILGIDQIKMYNYDPQVKNKRETSLFGKFFSLDNETGTKKPFRMIKDILSIQILRGENLFAIQFKDKKIVYMAKNLEEKERIVRKLNFLKHYNCEC